MNKKITTRVIEKLAASTTSVLIKEVPNDKMVHFSPIKDKKEMVEKALYTLKNLGIKELKKGGGSWLIDEDKKGYTGSSSGKKYFIRLNGFSKEQVEEINKKLPDLSKAAKIVQLVILKLKNPNQGQSQGQPQDLIPGGLGDDKTNKDFDSKQLDKGREIEMEHTDNPQMAEEIARDHLTEVPNYYVDNKGKDRLKKLETEAEKENKKKGK